jgi:hypothetical protein
VPAHGGDDRRRDRAAVQRRRPARGDGAQRPGEGGIAQEVALRQRPAVRQQVQRARLGVGGEAPGLPGDRRGEAAGHREAALGQRDGGLHEARPGQAAMRAMRRLEHRHRPRHADRAAPHRRLVEAHRRAVRAQEQRRRGGGRRGLAPVPGVQGARLAVPEQQQRAAADAARLRLDEGEHHLHRDRRIHGVAALAQHGAPGLGGERMRGGDHVAPGEDRLRARDRREDEEERSEQDRHGATAHGVLRTDLASLTRCRATTPGRRARPPRPAAAPPNPAPPRRWRARAGPSSPAACAPGRASSTWSPSATGCSPSSR